MSSPWTDEALTENISLSGQSLGETILASFAALRAEVLNWGSESSSKCLQNRVCTGTRGLFCGFQVRPSSNNRNLAPGGQCRGHRKGILWSLRHLSSHGGGLQRQAFPPDVLLNPAEPQGMNVVQEVFGQVHPPAVAESAWESGGNLG